MLKQDEYSAHRCSSPESSRSQPFRRTFITALVWFTPNTFLVVTVVLIKPNHVFGLPESSAGP